MSSNDGTKIIMAFAAGIAVGAAIGYFMNSDKKDELVADLKDAASKIKQVFGDTLEKATDLMDALNLDGLEADAETQPKS